MREEIEALQLYLDLEKLRFEELLSYSIEVSDDINKEYLIPTLLIQPYVENALKHGLLHKLSDRQLKISFDQNKSHDTICCVVEDNGIGRKRSYEVNKDRNPKHKSFASGAISNRLKLLNQTLKISIGEQIVDLYDDQGNPTGTKVIITIPIM